MVKEKLISLAEVVIAPLCEVKLNKSKDAADIIAASIGHRTC